MKKIIINKEQSRILSEAIMRESETLSRLPSVVLSCIDNGDYPLNNNKCLPTNCSKFIGKVLTNRFEEIGNHFSDDIFNVDPKMIENKLNKLISICVKKEQRIRNELEQLCFKTVSKLLGVSNDDADFECSLVDSIETGMQFHISPDTNEEYEYDDVESMDNEDIEVEKRKIFTTLTVGGAMRLSEEARKIYLHEVFDLDEDLPHLYSKIIKLNEFLLFRKNIKITDKNHMQSGFVKVNIGTDEQIPRIEVKATIFPILLMESIKGYLEIITSNSLPDDSSVATNVINKSDVLEDEPWQMMVGPSLWNMVFGECDTKNIPFALHILSNMKTENTVKLFKEIFCHTRYGKSVINRIFDMAKQHSDYDKFNGDIETKQDEYNNEYLITDDIYQR